MPAGSSAGEALANSVSLARHVDRLGFDRLWVSEHHAMATLASSAPEIVLARMGAETSRIRLGSGGIMLPHYAPLKVAEVFSTLAALYPDRIDLGLGRAPGGGPIESAALRRVRTGPQPDDFPEQLTELLAFLHGGFPASHPFSRIKLAPAPPVAPEVWLLGSSMWSAMAAAEYGLPYAFAHFFSGESTRAALELYRERFQAGDAAGGSIGKPHTMAAVGVVCAPTQAEADYLLQSVRLLQLRIRQNDRRPIASPDDAAAELKGFGPQPPDAGEFPRVIAGPPDAVRERLLDMAGKLRLDEVMVNTITWDHAARLRSYTLLAEAFGMGSVARAA